MASEFQVASQHGVPGSAVLKSRAESIIRSSVGGSIHRSMDFADLDDSKREVMLVEIAQQYLRGNQISQIAQNLGVEANLISEELKVLRQRWRDASLADFTQKRADELAKIDQLEATYWLAWDASQKAEVQQTRHEGFDGAGERKPARHVTKQTSSVGDVRFLDGVWKCIERRIKLLGLDAEQKHIVSTTVNTEHQSHELAGRMDKYAGLFGFTVVPLGNPDDAAGNGVPESTGLAAGGNGAEEPVDTARSARAASGFPDVIDAEFRDSS